MTAQLFFLFRLSTLPYILDLPIVLIKLGPFCALSFSKLAVGVNDVRHETLAEFVNVRQK